MASDKVSMLAQELSSALGTSYRVYKDAVKSVKIYLPGGSQNDLQRVKNIATRRLGSRIVDVWYSPGSYINRSPQSINIKIMR